MRTLVCAVLLCVVGCVTEETRQLAQGIHLTQVRQESVVRKMLNGVSPDDDEARAIAVEQGALTRATRTLSEILGEPKHSVEMSP